jgi:hypothetical protein
VADSSESAGKLVVPGMRFLPAWSTAGTLTVGAWEVVRVFAGTDGHRYARLANASDKTRVKSVSCDALLNRKLYCRAS